MTIKKKVTKEDIEAIINKGGSPTEDSPPLEESRFTLRAATSLMQKIDAARKKRPGKISMNQYIVEILEKIMSEVDS